MKAKQILIPLALVLSGLAYTAMSDTPNTEGNEGSVTKGVDLNKFNLMVEDVRTNPTHGQVEFRATGESEDIIYHSTARIGPFMAAGQEFGQTRQYVLHLGLPVELQGEVVNPVDRIEPVELALAGLSDCVIGTIAMHALVNEINIEQISVSVRAPLNLQVLLGIHGIDQRDQIYGKITIEAEIEGPDLTEDQRAFLSEQIKRSPVFNLVALAHDMDTTLEFRR